MFNSDILDVGLGLVLVFLMMSIIMTALQEGLEGIFKGRARHLEDALLQLLQGNRAMLQAFYEHPVIFAYYKGDVASGPRKGPTYIPREAFSAALIDMLDRPGGLVVPAGLKKAYAGLSELASKAGVLDEKRLRKEVEGWYDGAMDRASGWFKRRTQRNLFAMSLLAAIVLNINAVSIAQFLNANRAQREHLIKLADQITRPRPANEEPAPATDNPPAAGRQGATPADENASADVAAADAAGSMLDGNGTAPAEGKTSPPAPALPAGFDSTDFETKLYDAGLPLGWNEASRRWTLREFTTGDRRDRTLSFGAEPLTYSAAAVGLVVGYLVTALAAMLGAPFWFDILNRLMVVRSTVKPKEKSPDEPPTDK